MSHWLEMGFAMTRQTMLTATMMAGIVVSTSTWLTALIALVIIKKTVLLGLFPLLLEMVSVMTRPTMLTAIMMVETAVSAIQYQEILKLKVTKQTRLWLWSWTVGKWNFLRELEKTFYTYSGPIPPLFNQFTLLCFLLSKFSCFHFELLDMYFQINCLLVLIMWEGNVPHLPINIMHQEFVVTVVAVVVTLVVGIDVIMHVS